MHKIAVYKNGDLQFCIDVPDDRQQVKSEVYFVSALPFEVRDRIANYALGQSNIVVYREWRWAWKAGKDEDR